MIRSKIAMLCAPALLGGIATAAQSAAVGDWHPTRPLRLVVPFAPGGGADAMARLIQTKLAAAIGQSVVIDNRPGASGNIGAELVAKSPPDGHTVMMTTANLTIAPSVFPKLPFDVVKDFTGVSLLSKAPSILAVNPATAVKSVKELIALAKASPGKLNYAGDGGGPVELGFEIFKTMAGVDLTNVPYKSTGPAIVAVIGNEATAIMAPALALIPHIKSSRLRALGISSAQRIEVLPDIPTIAEAGVPKFEVNLWYGILAPAATPAPVVNALNGYFNSVILAPDIKARLINEASIPVASTPRELTAFVKADIGKWAIAAKKN
jgi:tripartite-type tricarboxylate transporter receptor subunit TctC